MKSYGNLPKADKRALVALEEWAGEVNATELTKKDSNKELAKFSGRVYETLHWCSSPDCRPNHPDWNPFPPKLPKQSTAITLAQATKEAPESFTVDDNTPTTARDAAYLRMIALNLYAQLRNPDQSLRSSRIERWTQLRKEGLTLKAIAQRDGISLGRVQQIMQNVVRHTAGDQWDHISNAEKNTILGWEAYKG